MHDTAHAPSRCRGHCVTTVSQIPFTLKVRRISFEITQGKQGWERACIRKGEGNGE
jgi:hypothetical protein